MDEYLGLHKGGKVKKAHRHKRSGIAWSGGSRPPAKGLIFLLIPRRILSRIRSGQEVEAETQTHY